MAAYDSFTGHTTLTPDQAKRISEEGGKIEFRDPEGRWLGVLQTHGLTPEDLAEIDRRRASKGPRRTAEQVAARLEALQKERDAKLHGGVGP